uniref:Proteasome activator complex subunit 4 n=1 Tax=Rhabditophanes sp. KR3021 TaxID=114890 RepID=A0AC35TN15_9BILA
MSDDDLSDDSEAYLTESEGDDEEANDMDDTDVGDEVQMMEIEGDDLDDTMQVDGKGPKKFQRERWQLKHLPYYDEMITEADEHFARIKEGLANSVLLREFKPSFTVWLKEFETYFECYGYRFTKQDHINLVKLTYGVLSCESVELRLVKNSLIILASLGKRKELLTYKDIVLDWKVLYKLYDRVCNKNEVENGSLIYPKGIKTAIENTVQNLRQFFPPSSVYEIHQEVRPFLIIFENTFSFATTVYAYFMPFNFDAAGHEIGRTKNWFNEMWGLLLQLETRSDFPIKMLQIFSRLTKESPGFIDWTDKFEFLFTRLMTALSLGVTAENVSLGDASSAMIEAISVIVVFSLGGKQNIAQDYLDKFFRTILGYFHPSNYGQHTQSIMVLTVKLVHAMCNRLNRERIVGKTALQPIPEGIRMKLEQLEKFTMTFVEPIKFAAYAKGKSSLVIPTVKGLAFIAPGIIIPTVLDMVYQGLETVTEPHRLHQSLVILHAITIPLVRDEIKSNKSTRLKVTAIEIDHAEGVSYRVFALHLMNALVNVIDLNDMSKTAYSFNALCNFLTLIHVDDCSEAVYNVKNLTKDEVVLCQATANFEIMVTNLFEKLTTLVEGMGTQTISGENHGDVMTRRSHKLNIEEQLCRKGISCIFQALIGNSSKQFNEMIITRMFDFVKGSMFNDKAAALIVKDMVGCCIRNNCDFAFPIFFKHLNRMLLDHLTPDVLKGEEPDSVFSWYLGQMISCINTAKGQFILAHREEIEETLDKVLQFESKLMFPKVAEYIIAVGSRLTNIYIDHSAINYFNNEKSFEEMLPIRNWAKSINKETIQSKFYVPSNEEITFAEHLLWKYCLPMCKLLESPENINEKVMLQKLTYISAFLEGISFRLPYITGKRVFVDPTYVQRSLKDYLCAPSNTKIITMPDGSPVRIAFLDLIVELINYMLIHQEDNTKAITKMASILNFVLFSRGMFKSLMENYATSYEVSKKMLNDPIRGRVRELESIFHDQIFLLHLKRIQMRASECFTAHHLKGIRAAWKMTLSTYTSTRTEAQTIIQNSLTIYNETTKFLIDDILKYIDVNTKHEQLKGALHNVFTGKRFSMLMRQDWTILNKIIPKLISVQSTTRESITNILDSIHCFLNENFETFNIKFNIPDHMTPLAEAFFDDYEGCIHLPINPRPTPLQLKEALDRENAANDLKEKMYYQLWSSLCEFVNDSSLHWRHRETSFTTMGLLIRKDMKVPDEALLLMVKQLVSDERYSREEVINSFHSWCNITKPKMLKVPYDLKKQNDNTSMNATYPVPAGYREDNQFLLLDDEVDIYNEKSWNDMRFFKDIHIGFYTWKTDLQSYAPPSMQLECNRKIEDFNAIEKNIISIFTDPKFIEQFLTVFTIEEKKNDSSKESGHQRLAAEIFPSLVASWRFWTFEKVDLTWTWLKPRIVTIFENINSENQNVWFNALSLMCSSEDPRAIKCIVDLTLDFCMVPSETNFHNSVKMSMIYYALHACSWRAPEQWNKLADLCFIYLEKSYQSVRDRIVDILSTSTGRYLLERVQIDPKLNKRFHVINYKQVLDKLSFECKDLVMDVYTDPHKKSPTGSACQSLSNLALMMTPERKRSLQYFKVMVDFVAAVAHNNDIGLSPKVIETIPILAHFENDNDEDLAESCHNALLLNMARGYVSDESCLLFLDTIKKAIDSCFLWKAKLSLFKVLQINIFSNIFVYAKHTDKVLEIILPLLLSEKIEVANVSAESLTGLVMCGYLEVNDALLSTFYKWVKSPLTLQRHAGALALSSVVQAYPYSVPSVLPEILMHLAKIVTDKQPISGTVKKAFLEFKRTHFDNWVEHKTRFNENQLLVINDLLVSPTYYV